MSNIEDYTFTITNEQGMEVKCDVISVVKDNDTNQTYVVYTDYLLTKNNKFRILVSELVKQGDDYILMEIKDEAKKEEIKQTSLTLHAKAYERLQEKYANID